MFKYVRDGRSRGRLVAQQCHQWLGCHPPLYFTMNGTLVSLPYGCTVAASAPAVCTVFKPDKRRQLFLFPSYSFQAETCLSFLLSLLSRPDAFLRGVACSLLWKLTNHLFNGSHFWSVGLTEPQIFYSYILFKTSPTSSFANPYSKQMNYIPFYNTLNNFNIYWSTFSPWSCRLHKNKVHIGYYMDKMRHVASPK